MPDILIIDSGNKQLIHLRRVHSTRVRSVTSVRLLVRLNSKLSAPNLLHRMNGIITHDSHVGLRNACSGPTSKLVFVDVIGVSCCKRGVQTPPDCTVSVPAGEQTS